MEAINYLFNKIKKKIEKISKTAVFQVFEIFFIFQSQLLTFPHSSASLILVPN